MGGACSANEGVEECLWVIGRRPLGRPRHRWVDSIKIGLVDIGWGVVDWIGLAQDRYRWQALMNVVMNLRGSIKC
jgi:hypothetical protein